jgi:hypothetical protein
MDGTRNLNHAPTSFIYSGPLMPRYISKENHYSSDILKIHTVPFISGFVYFINNILRK